MTDPTLTPELSPLKRALLAVEDMRRRLGEEEARRHEPIAIVGMACRLPGGANDTDRFWDLLRDGVDPIREVPADRWDVDATYDPDPDAPMKTYARWGGFVDEVDQFDPAFFGISPREAAKMDPQQRLLLEVAWEALERAGIAPATLIGARAGVFVGLTVGDYADISGKSLNSGATEMDAFFGTGTSPSIAAGRVSYALGLQGPAMTIDTACSSSLVAVHLGCQSLHAGESSIAIAGGVNLILGPTVTIYMSKAKALSPTGRCHTFDAAADGYVRGEGCGMVVLKRLSDAVASRDNILAVIRGTAVNHDGRSGGLTVPNGQAQQSLIRAALDDAGLAGRDVSYVEAHGTGTPLGDPIEMRAIDGAYGGERAAPLLVGSVKSNIGHLEGAAGVAGLIKVVLAMQHEAIPAHLHFRDPSPHIDWDNIDVRIPTELTPWVRGDDDRVAAVSAFGFSGTNAHIVLSEAPVPESEAPETPARPLQVLTVSARSDEAVRQVAADLAAAMARDEGPALADVAHTLNSGRNLFDHRLAVVAGSASDAVDLLGRFAEGERTPELIVGEPSSMPAPKVAFLFTGQGSQRLGMGRELYAAEPVFRAAIDECDELLRPELGLSLIDVIHPDANGSGDTPPGDVDDTTYTQPALFAVEYALTRLWSSWGVEPDMVLGHSIGGYVAAHLAGVMSLPDALRLVAARGRVMGALPRGGLMAAVFADESTVAAELPLTQGRVSIAALNGPQNTVISGPVADVERLVASFATQGIDARPLVTSHAFHSPLMEPALAEFDRIAATVQLTPPRRNRMVSDLTGALATDEVATSAYWTRHIRDAVRFADGVATLADSGCNVFLEIGPAPVLTAMGQRAMPDARVEWLSSMQKGRPEVAKALTTLGELWVRGVDVDWAGVEAGSRPRTVALPTYRFQRNRYWVPEPRKGRGVAQTGGHPLLGTSLESALRDMQFEVLMSRHQPSFNADRTWHDASLLSAATVAEMALAAGAAAFGADGTMTVGDVGVHEVVHIAQDQTWRVQTVVRTSGRNAANVAVYGRDDADPSSQWQSLAHAAVRRGAGTGPEVVEPDSITATLAPIPLDQWRAGWAERGLALGSRAQCIEAMWGDGDDEIWARLDLPADADHFSLYPPLIDECALVLGGPAAVSAVESIGSVVLAGPTPPAWCRIRRSTAAVDLFDAAGSLVAALREVRTAPLAEEPLPPRRDWSLQLDWLPYSTITDDAAEDEAAWLVIGLDDADAARTVVAQRLAAGPVSYVVVDVGAALDDADDVDRAVRALVTVVQGVSDAIWSAELSKQPRLWLCTRGAIAIDGSSVSPGHAALWGVMKSAAPELQQIAGGLLDRDPVGTADWTQVRSAISTSDGETLLALRDAQLHRARLRPLELPQTVRPLTLRPDGAHLITGGFGALGVETAAWAVEQGARHLVLVARSSLPPREQWHLLAETDPTAQRVATVRKLEALGASVEVASFDVADRVALAAFLASRREREAAPISAVFHAAGVLRDRSVMQLTADDITAVLEPKVRGTLNLHELLVDEPVEHFVLFSSTAGSLGSPGQANYAAANAFMDGLATARRQAGLPALSVNWGPWDLGMAARDDLAQRRERTGIHAIPVRAGFDLLGTFMAADVTNAMVMPISPSRFASVFAGSKLVDDTSSLHADPARRIDRAAEIVAAPRSEWPALIAKVLHENIGAVLGMSAGSVSPKLGLMDLGLDSLTIMELGGRLNIELGLALNPREFFEEPSVEQLAITVLRAFEQTAGDEADSAAREPGPSASTTDRVHLLATPGCPIDLLRTLFVDSADALVVDDAVAADRDQLDALAAADPSARFVHVTRHPFVALEDAADDQRLAEERWTTANGNLIDFAELLGPGRCALIRIEDVLTDPTTAQAALEALAGRPMSLADDVRAAIEPGDADAWRQVVLAQRPGRAMRSVAEELGYDIEWPPAMVGGQTPLEPAAAPTPAAVPKASRFDGAIPRVSRNQRIEASPAQERLLFIEEFQPGLPVYHLPMAFRLRGSLDSAALDASFSEVVRRHEALRTNFELVDGRFTQLVAPAAPVYLRHVDLRGVDPSELAGLLDEHVAREIATPFDVRSGLKIRGLVLRSADDTHDLVVTMHHIAADGWSMGFLGDELAVLYEASANGHVPTLAPLALQYADYSAWQREHLGSPEVEDQLSFWTTQLAGDLPVLDLPTDRPRTPARTFTSGIVRVDLPAELMDAVRVASRGAGVTPFMFLFGSYVATLARWSGQDDIIVGTATANRPSMDSIGVIGLFANTLAIRVPVDTSAPFTELARDVKQVMLGAFSHDAVPFNRIVEAVKPARDLSRAPIYQSMFVFNSESKPLLSLDGLDVERLDVSAGGVELDLSVVVIESPVRTFAAFEYSADLFDAATVERFVASWKELLTVVAGDPSAAVASLPLLGDEDRRLLLDEWGRSSRDVLAGLPDDLLHVDAQVSRRAGLSPDAVAVRMGDETLSYRQLDEYANRLALLLRERGVVPGQVVGVAVERSPQMVVSLLGVLKAGAAYLPLDPAFPADRLAFMVGDASVNVILVSTDLAAGAGIAPAEGRGLTVIDVSAEWDDIARGEPAPPHVPGREPSDLAYVIYTSGSTGRPKGVQIEHRSVVNLLLAMAEEPGIDSADVLLGVTTLSFDISVLELFLPLVAGAELVIASRDDAMDGEHLARLIETSGATILQATPTTWAMLYEAGWSNAPRLKALCGGEAMSAELADRLLTSCAEVWNMFGPTETTIWSTVHRVTAGSVTAASVPIGHPIANTVCRVLDPAGGLLPVGMPGELLIGGAGVARGYLGRSELTAERFITDPFATPGTTAERLYRTGDIARWRADGTLEYLGRDDNQVKVRGHRIELGEIESALRAQESIVDAVVVTDGSGASGQLVAYVIPTDPLRPPVVGDVRRALSRQLPDYMIPSWFVAIDEFPTTPNRKIDRNALPRPDRIVVDEIVVEPSSDVELVMAQAWAEVLGRPKVGVNQSFFELGGHSLLATRLVARLRDELAIDIGVRAIFEAPTIAELVGALTADPVTAERVAKTASVHIRLAGMSEDEVAAMLAARRAVPRVPETS